jgi:hypothetical protein
MTPIVSHAAKLEGMTLMSRRNEIRQQIEDAGDLKKYRTELPNLYDDAGMDPFTYRLLGHYKRVGKCTESVRTTAKHCAMSVGQVVKSRELLANEYKFIKVERTPKGIRISVLDVWVNNFLRYSKLAEAKRKRTERSQGEQSKSGVHVVNSTFTPRTQDSPSERIVHMVNDGVHGVNQRRNYKKKEQIKKEPKKKEQEEESVFSPHLESNSEFQSARQQFERSFFRLVGTDCHFFGKAWEQYPDLQSHERAMERMASETENPNLKFYTAIVRRIHNQQKFARMNGKAKQNARKPVISGKLAERASWYGEEESALIKR